MARRFAVSLFCTVGFFLAAVPPSASAQEPLAPNPEVAAEIERQEKIVERYLSLLERNPREGTSLDRAYGFYVEQGRIDEFVKRYRDRVKADETDGAAWMILGLIESRRGNDEVAIKAFTKASEYRSDDPLAPYYLGRALSIAGRPERAIAAFEEAISRKPARRDLPAIFVALGRIQGRLGNVENAGKVWNRLEAAFPGDARVKAEIAAVLENEGQLELALERYAELAKNADDQYRQVTYALKAAGLKVRLSQPKEAIADYEALLAKLNPESWLFREVRRGIENVFLRTDDHDGLASYYEVWIEQHPEDVGAMSRLAAIFGDLGRAEDAQHWFEKAVRLAPSDTRLRRTFIRSLRRSGKTKAAIAQFEALAELMPNNPDVIRDWGTVYLEDESLSKQKRKSKAAEIWTRLLDGDAEDPVITAQVADWFRQAGLTDKALALYAKAVEQAPDDPRYLEYLGEFQHRLGKSDKAVATWKKLAAGERRTRTNLVRLADVLSGFGYTEEALAVFRGANDLNLTFSNRLRFAKLLREEEKYEEALNQIAKAKALAESDEERQQALLDRIKTDQAAGRLEERIAELRKETEKKPSADALLTLALYLDAARDPVGAMRAAGKAVQLDPGSIPAQRALAKMATTSGQLAVAADAFRLLAALDQRGRTEYLKKVAGLEQRLGRVEEAMETGREVLASAPGSPDAYSFYADLCFRAGRTKDGLDALRRAVRFAPEATGPLLRLAGALAEQFRTDEAIALYWQAFETAGDFDDALPIVGRLAQLYRRMDRFRELIDRLQRTAGGERETRLLVAEAHQSVGNLGAAQEALEALLAENPRDIGLLARLGAIAEQTNDYETALQYQRKIVELAPADRRAKAQLARLYLVSDVEATDEFWDSLVADELDHAGTISLIDAMLDAGKYNDALRLTNRGLRQEPQDWELLYRRGFALYKQDKKQKDGKEDQDDNEKDENQDGAVAAFERLLALDLPDDTKAAKLSGRQPSGGTTSRAVSIMASYPKIIQRLQSARRSKLSFGFTRQNRGINLSGRQSRQPMWTPSDFGEARLAAIGWLAQEAPDCAFLEGLNNAVEKENAGARALWDSFYLASYQDNGGSPDEQGRVRRRLAELGEPGGAVIYLMHLAQTRRLVNPSIRNSKEEMEQLSEEELEFVLKCYDQLRQGNLGQYSYYFTMAVAAELGLAGREEQARKFIQNMLATTNDVNMIVALLRFASQPEEPNFALADTIFDRLESLPPGKLTGARRLGREVAKLMRACWDNGQPDKAMELLDRQLDLAERALEAKRSSASTGMARSRRYGVYLATKDGGQTQTSVTGPPLNGFLGANELTVLANAAYFYDDMGEKLVKVEEENDDDKAESDEKDEKADQDDKDGRTIDDLIAHLKERAEAATGAKAAMNYLAIASVLKFVNSEHQLRTMVTRSMSGRMVRTSQQLKAKASTDESWKDEALTAIRNAMKAAPNSYALRLTVAGRLIQREQKAEALALLEKVEPYNVDLLRRRELLVLQLAPGLSQVDRARAAAKRLFGLRLDPDTQLQLAQSMQRIGMSEQAEAVLSRLRHQSGGGLQMKVKLLQHYQSLNKEDVAVEIARTIVRQTNSSAGGQQRNNQDVYRERAVRVLKEAGQLGSLIERARRKAEAAPGSVKAQRQLATYLASAGKKKEAVAVLKKASANNPDDAQLKYELAGRIIAMGETDEALALYKGALKSQPELINRGYSDMRRAFRQAHKRKDLLKLLGEIEYSPNGARISYAGNAASNALNDDDLHDEALALFDALLTKNPDQRGEIFRHIRRDKAWENPMILGHALALLQDDGTSLTWQALSSATSYSGNGRIRTLFNNLASAAQSAKQGRNTGASSSDDTKGDSVTKSKATKEKFQNAITSMAKKNPDWQPGQALLAVIEASQGRYDEARERLRSVIDDKKTPIPDRAAWAVAVELTEYEPLRDLAIELAEQAADGNTQFSSAFQLTPEALLVEIYAEAGQREKARQIMLTKGMELANRNSGNAKYNAYQEIRHYIQVGKKMTELGFPIDALRIFDQYAADPQRVKAAEGYNEQYRDRELKQGREEAIKQITPARVAAYLEAATQTAPKDDALSFSLVMTITGDDFKDLEISSAIVTAIEKSLASQGKAKDPTANKKQVEAIASIRANIATLAAKRPDDAAVQTVAAITAYSLGDIEAAGKATKLLAALDETAAESKSPTKDERLSRVALWLVAREAARHTETQNVADELAARALKAAKALPDERWATAILCERGQMAMDADNREEAKSDWSEALELIIPWAKPPGEATLPHKTAPQLAPKPRKAVPSTSSNHSTTTRLFAVVGGTTIRTASIPATTTWSIATASISHPAPTGGKGPRRASLEQAKKALELANLAARNGMPQLSLRAVRASLAGGRPMKIAGPNSGAGVIITGGSIGTSSNAEIDRQIAERLLKVCNTWRSKRAESPESYNPKDVYDVLVAALLPVDRPNETLLYAPPLNESWSHAPKSAARELVRWAKRAGKLEELAKRLKTRRASNGHTNSLYVLRALTAYKSGDIASAKAALSAIKNSQAAGGSMRRAEMACHAALPGLSRKEVGKIAARVLTGAVAKYAMSSSEQPLGWLSYKLAKYNFQHDQPVEAEEVLNEYLAALPRIYQNYSGGYAAYRRRTVLKEMAQMLARFGRSRMALDRLGEALALPAGEYGGTNANADLFISGLVRRLAVETNREAYENLKAWTLPSKPRKNVRMLAAIAPAVVPPDEFDIPSDPATTAFGPDRVGVVTGTAVALIVLAKRHGDLAALTAEVDQLAATGVKNAIELSILLHCVAGTGAEVAKSFEKIVNAFTKKKADQTNFDNQQYPKLLLLAQGAAADPALRANAKKLAAKIEQLSQNNNGQFRAAARLIAVECATLEEDLAPAEVLPRSDFGPWAVARVPRRADLRVPRIAAVWAVRQGVARHLAGSQIDPLVFQYPLTGSFDMIVEAYDGSWAESQVGFGGLFYEPYGWSQKAKVYDIGAFSDRDIPFPGLRQGAYNTYRIEVRPDSTRCLINGKELHTDKQPSVGSPFLMLNVAFGRNSSFRDVRIEGDPNIPREVRLISNNRLDGWSGHATSDGKSQRPGMKKFDTKPVTNPTWTVADGVVTAHSKPNKTRRQSLLSYHRPLFDGESITYEFRLGNGDEVAHPALGRLVFLLRPEGVRLHWFVAEGNPEWTGLGPHNEIEAPQYERGPDRLPLKKGEWNRVRLSLVDDLIRIELNGQLVFERPRDKNENRVFGLFRYAGKSAHIRDIILRGDWPKTLSEETKNGLLRAVPTSTNQQLVRFERAIITEEHLRRPLWPMLDSLAARSPADRYQKLLAFVLPSGARPEWRLGGAFSPADPPPGLSLFGVESAPEKPRRHVGGRIVSAAGLLVSTAKELDKLDELAAKVDAVAVESHFEHRCQLAMQVLLATEQGDVPIAAEKLKGLLPLLKKVPASTPEYKRWPEMLAANTALNHAPLYDPAVALLNHIVLRQIQQEAYDSASINWKLHIRRLRGEAQALAETDVSRSALPAAPRLKYWRSAVHERASDRAAGRPRPLWQLRPNGEIWFRGGPRWQFLYLTVPVRGDIEVRGEFQTFAWREVQVRLAGIGTPPYYDHKNYLYLRYGQNQQPRPLPNPLTYGDWHSYRATVKDGVFTSWINGVKVHEENVGKSYDPWIALGAKHFNNGGVRNFTITGSPIVPEEIDLLAGKGLAGWRLYYPGSFTNKECDWSRRGAEIYGPKRPSKRINQSVLYYHRPMFEDGEISYEFFYEPNETLVHPALDRLVFLLDSEGVKIHWLTDRPGDRTGIDPRNTSEATEYKKGPDRLPLKPNKWNKVKLSIEGDIVKLTLNGKPIFERPLESTNQRNFGFFRYANETTARIRNIRYRGDWPKEFPPTGELFAAEK